MTVIITILVTIFIYQTILFVAICFDIEDTEHFLIPYCCFWSIPLLTFSVIRKVFRKVKKHKK